jgi:hypothetical protein
MFVSSSSGRRPAATNFGTARRTHNDPHWICNLYNGFPPNYHFLQLAEGLFPLVLRASQIAPAVLPICFCVATSLSFIKEFSS